MSDGTPHLAATYRRLAALCPPLDVALTGTAGVHRGTGEFTPAADPAGSGLDAGGPGDGTGIGLDAGRLGGGTGSGLDAGRPGGGGRGGPAARAAELIDGESDRILAAHGTRPRPDVAASRFLHAVLWAAGLLFTGPWFLTGSVPRIPAGRLTADPATGALTLDVTGLAPGPPGAGPRQVREAVIEHVTPLLEAFAPRVRRGPHALWGMVADDLASGLHYLGRATGDEAAGVRAAALLLPGGTAPLTAPAAFRTLRAPSGRTHTTRTRTGCCLYYAVSPDTPCVTCPRLTDGERLRRLEAEGG